MQAPARKFTLLDALVLMAALAAGLALARIAWAEGAPIQIVARAHEQRIMVENVLKAASCCAAMLSVGVLFLRLRPPRPRLLEMLQEPGVVGCSAATFSIVWFCTLYLLVGPKPSLSSIVLMGPFGIGMGIASAWSVIWFDGCWRPPLSWIDRVGRTLGICWFVLPLLFCVSLKC
jgi:hypothetical protein